MFTYHESLCGNDSSPIKSLIQPLQFSIPYISPTYYTTLLHLYTKPNMTSSVSNFHIPSTKTPTKPLKAPLDPHNHQPMQQRRSLLGILLGGGATAMLEARKPKIAQAENWGTHSFIKEKYFMPSLSPEDAVARIKQTTEGLKDMRHMLDTMSWRYVMFYIRLKSAYLDADLKNAMSTLPESSRRMYVKVANEVVDNMSELDRYVRSPKVYESYLYYEKTLKSLDELVAMLA